MRSQSSGIDYKDATFCKQFGKNRVQSLGANPPKEYQGLAAVRVLAVRDVGSDIVDSRHIFEGHADIKHGVIRKAGEPPDSAKVLALRERLKKLIGFTTYYPDPDPAADVWNGPAVRAI
jgi:hypothetical protein